MDATHQHVQGDVLVVFFCRLIISMTLIFAADRTPTKSKEVASETGTRKGKVRSQTPTKTTGANKKSKRKVSHCDESETRRQLAFSRAMKLRAIKKSVSFMHVFCCTDALTFFCSASAAAQRHMTQNLCERCYSTFRMQWLMTPTSLTKGL